MQRLLSLLNKAGQDIDLCTIKVNSVQEACAKCFAVKLLKYELLQITCKKMKKTSDPYFSAFHH